MALKDLPNLGCVDEFADGNVEAHGECTCRMSCRLLLLAELERTIVVNLKILFNNVDGRIVPQQCGQLLPFKCHSVRSFPNVLSHLRITKCCGKVNFHAV